MNRWGFLNVMLGALLAILGVAMVVLHTDIHTRNGYLIEGMVRSPAYGDYSPNPVFANGQTLQDEVEGTLARGTKAAGTTNPFHPTADVLTRGELIFKRDCLACHGPEARGDGTVVKKGFPPPPSLLTSRVRDFDDSRIFSIITAGGAIMPSYAAQIAQDDRWKTILYLRRGLQKKIPLEGTPVAATADAKTEQPWPGIALIGSNDCLACHAVDHKLVGPSFKEVAARYHGGSLETLVTKVKNGGSGIWGAIPMPAHPTIAVEQLRAIVGSILALDSKSVQGGGK